MKSNLRKSNISNVQYAEFVYNYMSAKQNKCFLFNLFIIPLLLLHVSPLGFMLYKKVVIDTVVCHLRCI